MPSFASVLNILGDKVGEGCCDVGAGAGAVWRRCRREGGVTLWGSSAERAKVCMKLHILSHGIHSEGICMLNFHNEYNLGYLYRGLCLQRINPAISNFDVDTQEETKCSEKNIRLKEPGTFRPAASRLLLIKS